MVVYSVCMGQKPELIYESLCPVHGGSGKCLEYHQLGFKRVRHLICEGEFRRVFSLQAQDCFMEVPPNSEFRSVSRVLEPHSQSFEQLTHITLSDCHVSRNDIISLINWFPKLEHFDLERLKYLDSNGCEQTPLSSRGPLKKLYISEGEKGILSGMFQKFHSFRPISFLPS